MARRRRGEEERKPELGFDVPDFDEDEFIRKETISFRTTLILFLYSVGTAFVTFLIWATLIDSWFAALLVGGLLGVALRWIFPALKVDVSHFGRKEWIGTGLLYFFSWLAFFIFFVNPPIFDGVAPELQVHITPDAQEPGASVDITILALDNVAVDESSIDFEVTGPDGATIADTQALREQDHPASWNWEQVFEAGAGGTYTVRVSVQDEASGWFFRESHTTTVTRTFTIGSPDDPVLPVFLSGVEVRDNVHRFSSPDDSVRVHIPSDVDAYRAWLQPADSNATEDRIPLRHDSDDDTETYEVWRAHPNFAGFQQGNNTFRVYVQEHDSYWLEKRYGLEEPQSPLVSSETYTVIIEDAALLGEVTVKEPRERRAEPEQVPAPGIALTLVGLLAAAVVVTRARRDDA